MLQQKDTTNQSSISPFTARGDVYQPYSPSREQQPAPELDKPENNRHRHFREFGNWSELAAGATGSASICFLFRLLNVAPAGYFVAALIAHAYFLVSASTDKRKSISHLMTGTASIGSAIATLGEPTAKWVTGQSDLRALETDYQQLHPDHPAGSNTLAVCGAFILIFAACITMAKGK